MYKNEEAVSPVVGVLLMIAVTLILAAIIGAFAFGMAGEQHTSKQVSIVAKKFGTTNVTLTIYGGNDVKDIKTLMVKINDGEYQGWLARGVGSTIELNGDSGITGTYDHIVVKGIFADYTEQILLDTHI